MPDQDHQKRREQDPNRPQSTDIADVEEMSEADYEAAQNASTGQRKKAPERKDVKARIIKRSHDGERNRVVIASGEEQGLRNGMAGYLMLANGHPIEHFTIDNCQGRTCEAFIDGPADRIIENPYVMINSSKKTKK